MGSAFSSITSKKQISQIFSGDYSRTNRKEITTMKGTCLHRMLTIYCRVVNTKSPVLPKTTNSSQEKGQQFHAKENIK